VIQLTGDNPEREAAILRECLNNPCAGIFLCTCAPGNTRLFEDLDGRMPLIFLLRRPEERDRFSCLGFNQSDTVYALTAELIRLGFEDISLYTDDPAFSCEAECLDGFRQAFQHMNKRLRSNRVFSIPFSKEAIFRSIMRLLDSGDFPPVFITTSYAAASAINEVAYFRNLELGRDLFLFALGEDSWYNSMFVNRIVCTYRDAQKLGASAAGVLKDRVEAPSVFETVSLTLPDGFAYNKLGEYIQRLRNNAPPRVKPKLTGKIRIAFNATDSGTDALKSLIPQFVKQHGVDVDFCPLPHHALHDKLVEMSETGSKEFDLFSLDAPWLPYLDSKSLLYDLTGLIRASDIPERMAPRVLEDIGSLDGRILGLPYTYSLSLLFYRKDLFSDPDLSAQFYEQYKVRLAPPRTWNMFNVIASFFTRSMNPESPTVFGTSIFGTFTAGLCSELFPRMWAYNGTVFDRRGFVRLYSRENLRAYLSLIQTIRCCSPDALGYNAFSGVQQLLEGETAMGVVFSNNASQLADSVRNPIKDKIGFAPIPDQKPVSSGWSIGVNRFSPNLQHAFNFIHWFSSMELASAFTILGGAAPLMPLIELEPLKQLYPWNKLVYEQYHTAVKREIPPVHGAAPLDEVWTEQVLGSVLFDYFRNKGTLDELLFHAHCALCQYAEEKGYPRNAPVSRLSPV
jgi:multiple sugar transport system substrate-binding protein